MLRHQKKIGRELTLCTFKVYVVYLSKLPGADLGFYKGAESNPPERGTCNSIHSVYAVGDWRKEDVLRASFTK